MCGRLIIIKLGGSAISDKSRPLSLREDWIRGLARLLRRFLREGLQAILIHGGGSFAHPVAYAYGLKRHRNSDQLIGVSLTSSLLALLSHRISLILAEEGVPVYPIRTGSIITLRDSKPHLLVEKDFLLKLVNGGVVPMLHGDVALSDRGFEIISGDDIALLLAQLYRPTVLLFLMDVPGILDRNGRTIVELDDVNRLICDGESGIDVTGGIMAKALKAFEASRFTRVFACAIWDLTGIEEAIRLKRPKSCTEFKYRGV